MRRFSADEIEVDLPHFPADDVLEQRIFEVATTWLIETRRTSSGLSSSIYSLRPGEEEIR